MTFLSNTILERGRTGTRNAALDGLRGIAVLAMVVFHTAWDLSDLRLVATEISVEPGWRLFARVIAATFLLISGVSLALAHRDGIRWRSFGRRLLVVAGAALVVTVATLFVFPDSFIFFGILHCIAAASLLALPVLRAPPLLAAAAGLAVLALPSLATASIFDEPVLAFLGLGWRVPVTNDYVPLFPWSGFVLIGVAAGRFGRDRLLRPWPVSGRLGRGLAAIGRHSLAIYLLHQPLLFGALAALAALVGPNPAAEAVPFLRNCRASCTSSGADEAVCRSACDCTTGEIRSADLLHALMRRMASPDEIARVQAMAQGCFARARDAGAAERPGP